MAACEASSVRSANSISLKKIPVSRFRVIDHNGWRRLAPTRANGRYPMSSRSMPGFAGLILGILVMTTSFAGADALKDEIAPTGKLRVAIAISPAGGAFWSTKTESGYAGVPVDLGREMAAQLGVPVEYVTHNNSGLIVDAAGKGTWDVTFLPKDPEREARLS